MRSKQLFIFLFGIFFLVMPISGHCDIRLKWYANQLFLIQNIFGSPIQPVRLYTSGFLEATEHINSNDLDQSDLLALIRVLNYKNRDEQITKQVIDRSTQLLISYPYEFDERVYGALLATAAALTTSFETSGYASAIIEQRSRANELTRFREDFRAIRTRQTRVFRVYDAVAGFPTVQCQALLTKIVDRFKNRNSNSTDGRE